MPVWDLLWVFIVWSFYVLCWLGALILVFGFAVGVVRGLRSWRKPKKPARVNACDECGAWSTGTPTHLNFCSRRA